MKDVEEFTACYVISELGGISGPREDILGSVRGCPKANFINESCAC